MASYLYSLLSFSLLISVFSYLSFSDKARRTVAVCGAVLFFFLMLSPLTDLVSEISRLDIGDYLDGIKAELPDDGEYLEAAKRAYTEGVRHLVSDKFSLEYSEVFVECYGFDFEKMSAESIKVTLKKTAAFADNRSIAEYVSKALGAQCIVEVLLK